MIARKENLEIISTRDLAREIVLDGFDTQEAVTTEEAAQNALADLYVQAYNIEIALASIYSQDFKDLNKTITLASIDKSELWKLVKDALCDVLREPQLLDKIIEVILGVIANAIPLGILIKKLVKIIINYLLSIGIGAVCPAS